MEQRKDEVSVNVEKYFREHLPAYEVMEVRKKSGYEEDSHLYMVAGKKADNTFAVWTCWNEKLQTLNHGHYGIKDLKGCQKIMDGFYCNKD